MLRCVLALLIGVWATTAVAQPDRDTVPVPQCSFEEQCSVARDFYRLRANGLAWLTDGTPAPALALFAEAIRQAATEGLDPARYDSTLELIERVRAMDAIDARRAAALDMRLSLGFFQYASDLAFAPSELESLYHTRSRDIDLASELNRALDTGGFGELLRRLLPQHPEYASLREARARYRAIAEQGGWPSVRSDVLLRAGDSSPEVVVIRNRLLVDGDLHTPGDAPADLFDVHLEAAVIRFQQRHGLEPDGIVGPRTAAAMNVTAAERARQLAVNMDRWRWLAESAGEREVRVNIPAFRLAVFTHDRPSLEMRVVVGTTSNPTPVFDDVMQYVVFNPYWNIPISIARTETLPAARRDPGYLDRNNIDIVEGWGDDAPLVDAAAAIAQEPFEWSRLRFRQRSGPGNSLGRVKFMFPNHFNVYIHDTPADHLFERVERDFSHGCVRADRPVDLAVELLGWDHARADAAIASGARQAVRLPETIPVRLLYMTAWVDDSGRTQFRHDLYGYDSRHERFSFARSVRLQADLVRSG